MTRRVGKRRGKTGEKGEKRREKTPASVEDREQSGGGASAERRGGWRKGEEGRESESKRARATLLRESRKLASSVRTRFVLLFFPLSSYFFLAMGEGSLFSSY